jgi:hypothetical protein
MDSLPLHINNQIIQYIKEDDDIIKFNVNVNVGPCSSWITLESTNNLSQKYQVNMKLLDIKENLFIIESDIIKHYECYFKGRCKLIFSNGITHIHLTPEANIKLFDYLYNQYPTCNMCNKKFDISISSSGIKNNDEIVKLSHSECQCQQNKKPYPPHTPGPVNIHASCMESAFVICSGNGKEICNNKLINNQHLDLCSICKTKTCYDCKCEKVCEECDKHFCTRTSDHNELCDECTFQCEICDQSYKGDDMCSCDLCEQHNWCEDCVRTNNLIILKPYPNDTLLNIICIECDNKSKHCLCRKCGSICNISDFMDCNDCDNHELCKRCLVKVYSYDDNEDLRASKVCNECYMKNYHYTSLLIKDKVIS